MFSDHFNGLICFSRVGMTRVECLRYKGLVRVGEKKPSLTGDVILQINPMVNRLAEGCL